MQPADKIAFVQIITGLQAIKPGQKLTVDGIEMFWLAMQSWPIDEFKAAATHLANTVEFMPNPYHFNELRKAGQLTAAEAWTAAMAACCGYRKGVVRVTPRIDKAVAAVGGYERLAMANTETQLPHIMRNFIAFYEELSDVESVRMQLPTVKSVEVKRIVDGQEVRVSLTDNLKRLAS